MSNRSNAQAKKPTGGRPLPRRLFSFDSLRKEAATPENDAPGGRRKPTLKLGKPAVEGSGDPFNANGEPWTEKELVSSPGDSKTEFLVGDEPGSAKNSPKPLPLNLDDAKNVLRASDEMASQPPPSPSRRRWDTIRQHMLPSVSSLVSESTPATNDLQRSGAPPKQPASRRLAQKKMYHVVDEVQTDLEAKRLEREIHNACWTVRFGELPARPKVDRDAQSTMGSSLHLPFMSSNSVLPLASSSSSTLVQMSYKQGGLKRPPSVQSLALAGHNVASVTQIARALTSSTSSNRPKILPSESKVLTALLVPFLSPHPGMQVEAEQATAVETFEYTVRTWKAPTNEAKLERCLWCCKAASVPTRSRTRILGTLSSLLFSRDNPLVADTPSILSTVLQALFSLIATLSGEPDTDEQSASLTGYVAAIRSGKCGELNVPAVEKEYGVRYSKSDTDNDVREAIVAESVVRCLELGPESNRRWILRHLLEDYWSREPNFSLSPLLVCIHWRKLHMFIGASLTLLANPSRMAEADGKVIIGIFRSRILPETEAMRTDEAADIQVNVVRLVLELLCMHESEDREYVLMHFCDWYQHKADWKESIQNTLAQIIQSSEWSTILRQMPSMIDELPEEAQASMMASILPLINERLVSSPPEDTYLPLSRFLDNVSRAYPKAFYKPLFTCAAASKDATVVHQLCILSAIAKIVPGFWIRDPEMMSIALMSDSMSSKKPKTSANGSIWGKARLGQSVILLELIQSLREVREAKDMSLTVSAVKFAAVLETRLGILIEAKEQTTLIPESQRLLLCTLFREIRLLTHSLKTAMWLPSVVSWCLHWQPTKLDADRTAEQDNEPEDVATVLNKLLALYVQAQDSSRSSHKRQTTLMSSPSFGEQLGSKSTDASAGVVDRFSDRIDFLNTMSRMLKASTLELLVTISGLLDPEHYRRLAPILWSDCMDDKEARVIAPACFLVMQCAEKSPEEFTRLVEDDLSSPDTDVRLRAIQRIGTLSSWRYQLLSQEVILDRTHKRPFKLARPAISFVATDIGTGLFVYEEDPEEYRDTHGRVLPLELRRRLSEIGWGEENKQVDQRTEWIRTPMSLLPSTQLDRLDHGSEDLPVLLESRSNSPSPSPEPSPTKISPSDSVLSRQDSTSNARSRGTKRRPVFVSTLLLLFLRLAPMVSDHDFVVSSSARDLIMDFMRDDPALLSRSVFNLLSGDGRSVITATSTLRAFLHVQHVLPPGMAHHVLNHLTGFLKSSVRHSEAATPLRSYAYSMPIISNLVTQVSKLSMRDIRRAKIDTFLIPSGSLWFPPTAPAGPLFPRTLEDHHDPFETVPPPLVWITLIRTAQNQFFTSMLKRNPQEIKVIRKHMTILVLPSLLNSDHSGPPGLLDMVPRKHDLSAHGQTAADATLTALSLTLSRSYLLLVGQIFQSMSRHLNDRNELAIFMDSINRILLTHGSDIGIVAHSLIALMTASTRFKRLFTSGGGYTLFMPVLIKVYVEAQGDPGIQEGIEYAIRRFYALHQESFVFQTLDVMSHIIMLPGVDDVWVASGIFALISSLGSNVPPSAEDAAGIHGINKMQEKEALMLSVAEEVPQTFLAALRKGNGQDRTPVPISVPEEYELKRFGMDNLIRLFLTVIAHNTSIQRAEYFLRFLRLLTHHLYNASHSARVVLDGGITALGNILLTKATTKAKIPESAQLQPIDSLSYEVFAEDKAGEKQSSSPSNLLTMRLDYLSLVLAFTRAGGHLDGHTSQRVIELVKVVLKESRANVERVSTFLADYTRSILMRESAPDTTKPVVTLLSELSPVISAYSTSVDFSGVYEVVAELAGNTVFGRDAAFAHVVVTQYCRIGLDACDIAASEDLLFKLPVRSSLLRLLTKSVAMVGADVMTELDQRPPTYDYLAGVILPFALSLKTTEEIMAGSQYAETSRRDAHVRAWVRLLSYVLVPLKNIDGFSGIQRSSSLHSSEHRKSQDSSRQPNFTAVMTLAIALQILKVIVLRAEDDITSALPGIWGQIGGILKLVLSDGNTSFALKSQYDYSEPPSPSFSPRASTFSEQQQHPAPQFPFPTSISMHGRRHALSAPRMIDYLTWSFIQWLWLRRSPLMIQMRILVQEKMATLAEELPQQGRSISNTRNRRISSVFSKPRRSMISGSAASSAASTPRNSMFLSTSVTLPSFGDFVPGTSTPQKERSGRQAGYELMPSPNSPSRRTSQESTGPKIVHLGPQVVGVSRSVSPGGTRVRDGKSVRIMAREMMINSPLLIRMTYRRIRLVQQLMGYRTLLPLDDSDSHISGDESDNMGEEVRAWSKRDAIEAVVQETRDLLDEYQESYCNPGDESAVMVDSFQDDEWVTQGDSIISLVAH